MRNHSLGASLLAAAAVLGSNGTAHANLIVHAPIGPPTTVRTDIWQTEPGQSIPTNTAGFVDGTLFANDAGSYTFTYGPTGLVPGATGHGNSVFINEFWVGTSEAAAEAAGHVFCTQAGDTSCGGVASTVGQSFAVTLASGNVPFGFTFGPNNTNVLLNGQVSDAIGAYLAQIGLGTTANTGSGPVAYLGLSDNTYPADHDFQDLTVGVVENTPEPASVALLGSALIGMAFGFRRRTRKLHRNSF